MRRGQSDGCGDGREDERFDEQLSDDAAAARTKRGSHGNLRFARGGPGIDQGPDRGTRDQEGEQNRQVPDAVLERSADRRNAAIDVHVSTKVFVSSGRSRRRALGQDGELGGSLRETHTRCETAEYADGAALERRVA